MIRSLCRRAGVLLSIYALVLVSSCTGFKQKVAPPPVDQTRPATPPENSSDHDLPIAHYRNRKYYIHEVRWPNETLELIAQWYTGKGSNWKALLRATPNLRHNRIHQGDVVFIPIDMLQIETPMPKQYVQQRHSPATVPAPDGRSRRDGAPPQPYGPRPYPKQTNP
jgi:hypothetical protein